MSQTEKTVTETPLKDADLKNAERVVAALQEELKSYIAKGSGPFLAAVYDEHGQLIAKEANSVVLDNCSHCHAEMNVIRAAQQALKTYDLSPYRLRLYVTAEPCMMCLGGILWSGIQAIYYGVPSDRVQEITGFDEGYKPDWQQAFKKRGIAVFGPLAVSAGERVLKEYIQSGRTVYRPDRKQGLF